MAWLEPEARRAASIAVLSIAAVACGHSIDPGIAFQHRPPFDFARPPCSPAPRPVEPLPDDQVVVRYLGAGGLYVEWRGEAILTAPYFTNPGLVRSLGRLRWDRDAIARGTEGMAGERVGAILAGHSHYDHLGDLPPLARDFARRARLYVNESGLRALAGFRDLGQRTESLQGRDGAWTLLTDAAGRRLPFRVLAVKSDHAPHLLRLMLWGGDSKQSGDEWTTMRYPGLKAGEVYAFVIDLLEAPEEGARVRFRIFSQDSAAKSPRGLPPPPLPGDPPYDLAMLCMASAHLVKPYPDDLLATIQPRRALVTHYENFFRPWGPRRGFVPMLTHGRANRFLRQVQAKLDQSPADPIVPVHDVCGPSAARWTMPLTGEWMVFPTRAP